MNIRRLFSDAGISALRVIVLSIRSLLIISIITKLIGSGAQGIWATILALVGLFASAGGLHMHGALIRYSPSSDASQVFSDTLTVTLMMSILTGAIFYILSGAILSVINPSGDISTTLMIPAAVYTGASLLSSFLSNYPRALRRVKRYEALLIALNGIEVIVLAVTLYLSESLLDGFWALALTHIIFDFVFLFVFSRDDLTIPDISTFPLYLRYAVPMVPKELSGTLLSHADKILIIRFLGPSAAGIYTVSYTISSFLQKLAGIFNSTLYPNVTAAWENEEFDELSRFYSNFLRGYVLFALPAIGGLSFLSVAILRFISTPEIAVNGEWIVPILAVGFAFQGAEGFLSYPLQAAEETTRLSIITFFAVILNLCLNLVLLPIIGLEGAAVATTVSFGFRTVLLFHLSKSIIDFNFPILMTGKAIAATTIMVIVLIMMPINSQPLLLVVAPVTGVLIYFVSLWLVRGPFVFS